MSEPEGIGNCGPEAGGEGGPCRHQRDCDRSCSELFQCAFTKNPMIAMRLSQACLM